MAVAFVESRSGSKITLTWKQFGKKRQKTFNTAADSFAGRDIDLFKQMVEIYTSQTSNSNNDLATEKILKEDLLRQLQHRDRMTDDRCRTRSPRPVPATVQPHRTLTDRLARASSGSESDSDASDTELEAIEKKIQELSLQVQKLKLKRAKERRQRH